MDPKAQPKSVPSQADTSQQHAVLEAVIASHRTLPGALMPMLHAIQDQLGFVPASSVPRLAEALNLSQAEVHGVVTFYHDFRSHPPGRHVLKLCRAEACQAMGCEQLEAHLRERHGLEFNSTTDDHAVTLEPVYCLGNCAASPSVLVDGEVRGRVTSTWLDQWIQNARCQEGTNR
jgi:formate dehydrogenase subunit gamma